jgi:hypothetical protein
MIFDEPLRPLFGAAILVGLVYWQLSGDDRGRGTAPIQINPSIPGSNPVEVDDSTDRITLESAARNASAVNRPRKRDQIIFWSALLFVCSSTFVRYHRVPTDLSHTFGAVSGSALWIIVFAVLPAYVMRGRHGDRRGYYHWCAVGAVLMAGLLVISNIGNAAQSRRTLQEKKNSADRRYEALKSGSITIDEFIRVGRASDPSGFDRGFVEAAEAKIRTELTGGTLSNVRLMGITEKSEWVKGHIGYEGILAPNDGGDPMNGQLIIYYHRDGLAVIESACLTAEGDCGAIRPLVESAESELVAHLQSTGILGVLPASEQCSIDKTAVPNSTRTVDARTCLYPPHMVLSFGRVGAADTIIGFDKVFGAKPN